MKVAISFPDHLIVDVEKVPTLIAELSKGVVYTRDSWSINAQYTPSESKPSLKRWYESSITQGD